MVRSEGNMSLKNPVTPLGIDPGTVRLVAQRLNHYATARYTYRQNNITMDLKIGCKFVGWVRVAEDGIQM